jgi:hypothetical protein
MYVFLSIHICVCMYVCMCVYICMYRNMFIAGISINSGMHVYIGELVSGGEDRTARVWRDGQCVGTIPHGNSPSLSLYIQHTYICVCVCVCVCVRVCVCVCVCMP